MLSKKLLIPFVVLVALGLAPIVKNKVEQTNDLVKVQASEENHIATLSDGKTNYAEWGGNADECIVLVHGASGPMGVWNKIAPELSKAGYRVIAYDLFGRGISDRPDTTYDLQLFRRQLQDLIQHRQCKGPVNLVGSSMGAIVVTDYATSAPENINKVAIIGPAGFPIEASPAAKLLQIPLVGEYLITLAGKSFLSTHNAKYFVDSSQWPEAATDYAEQFKFPGYKIALLSTMREMPMEDFRTGYEALGKLKSPVALIWGREDITFPVVNFEDAKNYLQSTRAHIIEDAAHVPQYEQGKQVSDLLIDFFEDKNGPTIGQNTP